MGRKHIGVQAPTPPPPPPGLSSPLLHWGESVGLRVIQWILSWAPQISPLDPVSVLGGVPGERGISRKLPGSAMALLTPISWEALDGEGVLSEPLKKCDLCVLPTTQLWEEPWESSKVLGWRSTNSQHKCVCHKM